MGFVKHAARAITKPVEHAVKSVVHNPVKALPAVVGIATGNPWAVAGAGAVSGAAVGGVKGAVRGAVGAGLGAAAGGTLGSALGSSSTIGSFLGSSVAPTALAAAGATYGANTALKKFIQQPALAEAYAPPTPLPDPVPTFKLQKQNAIAQTETAFQENGINNILNGFLRNSRLRDNSKEITIYNGNKFYNPSLKEYMKMVKKKLGIKTSVVYAKDRDRVHLD